MTLTSQNTGVSDGVALLDTGSAHSWVSLSFMMHNLNTEIDEIIPEMQRYPFYQGTLYLDMVLEGIEYSYVPFNVVDRGVQEYAVNVGNDFFRGLSKLSFQAGAGSRDEVIDVSEEHMPYVSGSILEQGFSKALLDTGADWCVMNPGYCESLAITTNPSTGVTYHRSLDGCSTLITEKFSADVDIYTNSVDPMEMRGLQFVLVPGHKLTICGAPILSCNSYTFWYGGPAAGITIR